MKRIIMTLAIAIVGTISLFAQSSSWELLRAEYGSGGTWMDVTARVRSLVRGNSLNIHVDNETLGGDPIPGTAKTLRMQVRDEFGGMSVLSYQEKDFIGMSIRTGGPGSGTLQVTRAQYGANNRFIDVTDLLNSRIQGGQLSLRVASDTMGGDPAYDARKVLVAWYTYNGHDSQVTVNEGDYLSLPGAGVRSQSRLQILRADYGADNRYANVTSRLATRIQGDGLSLRVTNDTMGGDPAEDHHKNLTVWYSYDGRTASTMVDEGNYLSLPGNNDYLQDKLRVLRAQYGSGYGYFDVTGRLNSQLRGDALHLRVTNDTMGGDPADDKHKQLSVVYIYNGQQYYVVVKEKDELILPGSGTRYGDGSLGEFQILQAMYGDGNRRRDVTDRLNAQVRGNQLQIQVSNATMGGDPAEGHPKRLKAIYLWQGLRYAVTATEGETIVIP